MKTLNNNYLIQGYGKVILLGWCMMGLTVLNAHAHSSQDDEKARVRIGLNYFKIAEDSCYLTVKVLTKPDRKYIPVSGVIINLFLNEQTKSGMMGNITTDKEGWGTVILPDKFYSALDTLITLNFMARLKNDPNYQDKITTIEIKDASMIISYEEDSLKAVKVILLEKDSTGRGIPVEGADIKFYVQRLFSLLPIGNDNNFTDEQGEVILDFPTDLPGDAEGNLEVFVKLEDDDDFGNIIVNNILPWGSDQLIVKDTFDERSLWSPRDKTPYYLLIFPNLMLLAVWMVIFYLIIQLVKIYVGRI
jgi:hypothetical protein